MPAISKPKIQPCNDPKCGVHGRGADPDTQGMTCARQILRAYDRPGAIALLEQQPVESCEFGEERSILPLSSASVEGPGLIQHGQSYTIVARAKNPDPWTTRRHPRSFRPERLILSAAGTADGTADWVVNDIVLDGRSQVAPHRDLPGAIFGATVLGTLRTFDRISGEAPVQLTTTYVGSNPQGVPLFASLVGASTYERRSIRLSCDRLPTGAIRELTVRAEHAMDAFRVCLQGPASRVVVSDIRFGGTSQFRHPGDIPGELFESRAVNSFVSLKPIAAGDEVVVVLRCLEDLEEPIVCAILGQEPGHQA